MDQAWRAATAVVILAVWMVLGRMAAGERVKAIKLALADIDSGSYSPEAVAELHRAAGDYLLHDNKPEAARNEYIMARAALMAAPDKASFERELALIDLALSQIALSGSQKQIDERTRLRWEDVYKEIRQTWQNLETPEARIEAIRQISRALVARQQGTAAVSLASQFPERSELLGVVGLEMLRGQDEPRIKSTVEQLASQAENLARANPLQALVPAPAQAKPGENKPGRNPAERKPELGMKEPVPAPSLIALWLVLGKMDKASAIAPPPEPGKKVEGTALLGYVQGLAELDKWDDARGLISLAATPLDRLRAIVALAEVAADKEKLPSTRTDLEAGLSLAQNEFKGNDLPPWLLFRLTQLALQANVVEPAQPVIRLIPDAALRGRVQLQELRDRLAGTAESAETGWAEAVDAHGVARGLALEAITRHNAPRLGGRPLLKQVAGWEVEKLRPFGYIGIALGLQDGDK
jgi:hypothetical protein